MDAAERFWIKVDKTSGPCWIWQAGMTGDGYGLFRVEPKRRMVAHRFAYELEVGPIPEGLTLDHLCRTRACVNPAHLEPVTRAENTRRGLLPALSRNGETCRAGLHPWPEAARSDRTRGLYCYECKLIANRRNGADGRRRKRLAEAGGIATAKYKPMPRLDGLHHEAPSAG